MYVSYWPPRFILGTISALSRCFHLVLFQKTKLNEIKKNGRKKEKVSEKIENENKNNKKTKEKIK